MISLTVMMYVMYVMYVCIDLLYLCGSMLGPLPSYRDVHAALSTGPASEVVHCSAHLLPRGLRSGVAYHPPPEAEDTTGGKSHDRDRDRDCHSIPLDLPVECFASVPLKSLISKNFTYFDLDNDNNNIPCENSISETDSPIDITYLDDANEEVSPPTVTADAGPGAGGGAAEAIGHGDNRSEGCRERLVAHLRESRKCWRDNSGGLFPTHCMGEGYSQTVLESTAKAVVDEARVACGGGGGRKHSCIAERFFPSSRCTLGDGVCSVMLKNMDSPDHEKYINTYVKKLKSHLDGTENNSGPENNPPEEEEDTSSPESKRRADVWNILEDICAEGSGGYSFKPAHLPARQQSNRSGLSPFSVQKVEGCINTTSPLWLDMDQKKAIFRSGPGQDKTKHIFFRLGDQLLELLAHMAIVKCHLSGDVDGLFVSKLAQVLIEQSERDITDSDEAQAPGSGPGPGSGDTPPPGPTAAQLCLSYLESMNLSVLRAVRVGNLLVANEASPLVAPLVTCSLPAREELLLSSSSSSSSSSLTGKKRVARTYRPV
jgi:hypothetical protein